MPNYGGYGQRPILRFDDPPDRGIIGFEDPVEERKKLIGFEDAPEDDRSVLDKTAASIGSGLSKGLARTWDFIGGLTSLPTRAGITEQSGDYPGWDYPRQRAEELRAGAPTPGEGAGYKIIEALGEVPGQALKYGAGAALATATGGAGILPMAAAMGGTDVLDVLGQGGSVPEALKAGALSAGAGALMGGAAAKALPVRALAGSGAMGVASLLSGASPEEALTSAATGAIIGGISKRSPANSAVPPPTPTASGLPTVADHVRFGEARKTPDAAALESRFKKGWVDSVSLLDEVSNVFKKATGKTTPDLKEVRPTDLSPEKDPYWLARATQKRAGAQARFQIVREQTDLNGETIGKGLADILAPVGPKELRPFFEYSVARHEADLAARAGIPAHIDPADMVKVISEGDAKGWNAIHNEMVQWRNNESHKLVEAGHMTQTEWDTMTAANPYYVPLKRVFESATGGGAGTGYADLGSPLKKRSGKEVARPVEDPLINLVRDSERIAAVTGKTRVAQALASFADQAPVEMAPYIEKVQPPKGMNPMEIRSWEQMSSKDHIVRVVRNGAPEYFKLDPELYSTMKGMDKLSMDFFSNTLLGQLATKAKRGVTLGATGVNAGFQMITNPLRDTFTAALQAPGGNLSVPFRAMKAMFGDRGAGRPYEKLMKAGDLAGAEQLAKQHPQFEARKGFERTGGFTSGPLGASYEDLVLFEKEMLGNKSFKDSIVHPVEALKRLLSATEAMNRVAEFKRVHELYGGQGQAADIAASVASADVTVDFAKMGNTAQFVGQMVPFFTASISGLDTMAKAVMKSPVKTAALAVTGLTAPKLAMWYMNKDEQWYQELPKWEKNLFTHIKVGNEILRVPMPYGWGQAFGAIPEEIANGIYQKDPKGAGKAIAEAIGQALPVNIAMTGENRLAQSLSNVMPAFAKPAVESMMNLDMFRGSPIESQAMQNLVPSERYNESTPEVYKAMGRAAGISPLQIQHVLEGYTGGLIRDFANAPKTIAGIGDLKNLMNPAGDTGEAANIPFVGRLFSRKDRTGASVTDFYDRLKEDEQIYGTYRKFVADGDYGKASQYMEKYSDVLSRLKMERKIAERLRDLKKVKDIKTATELARYALGR